MWRVIRRFFETTARSLAHAVEYSMPGQTLGIPVSQFDRSPQRDEYSCGARCSYMITQHFGLRQSYAKVKKGVKTTTDGTYDTNICKYFRKLGFKVRNKEPLTLWDLRRELAAGSVAIATVDNLDHYMVVHGVHVRENRVTHVLTADPSVLRGPWRRVSVDVFLARWDRHAILVRE